MADTQSQIQQMSQFILAEAKDKAEEITTKALQEFSVEKMKMLNQMKDKTRDDYARKTKAIETQMAIARSTAVNQSRLEKVKTRQAMLTKIKDDTEKQLVDKLRSEAQSKPFITKLIVQGLLMLLEENVQVRCRAVDDKMVQSCLEDAAAQYSQVIQKETGASRSANLTLDKQIKLPPAPTEGAHGATCIGGIVLACQNGSITIDNTIDSRLGLVMEQAKPTIRQLLFGNERR